VGSTAAMSCNLLLFSPVKIAVRIDVEKSSFFSPEKLQKPI
jgi:hypothetical protein